MNTKRFLRPMGKLFSNLQNYFRKNKAEAILLLLILLVAAFLRLYRIEEYLTFLGDEGRDALVVKRMIVDHKWTLLGPTASVGGFFLGPIYYYFILPFLWLFNLNPVGPAVMVALFGIATVGLVYLAGREWFSSKVGLIAASLYAVSPLVIGYSRSSWNPNLMPFFSLLIFFLARRAIFSRNPIRWGIIGVLLGITLQLHYLAVFLMVIIGAYFLLFAVQRKNLKTYFIAVGGFLAGWSPFLLFELRHGFPNARSLINFFLHGKETGLAIEKSLPVVLDLFPRLFSRLITHNQSLFAMVLMVLSIAYLLFKWVKSRKKSHFQTYSLMVLWLLAGTGLFLFYQDDIYDYYLAFMFPLPFFLTALFLEKISGLRLPGKAAFAEVFLLLLALNLWGNPFRYEPNRQLEQTRQIARFVLEKTNGEPYNFALITGGNSDHAYRYFLEIWGQPPVTIENPQIDPERKSVTNQLLIVCESVPCEPRGYSLWEIAGFGQAQIEGRWPVSVVEVYKMSHYKPPAAD